MADFILKKPPCLLYLFLAYWLYLGILRTLIFTSFIFYKKAFCMKHVDLASAASLETEMKEPVKSLND